MKKTAAVIIAVAAVSAVFIAIGLSRKRAPAERLGIAVIPKGTTHIFWQSVRAGAEAAGSEIGARIFWNGPERESDREKQIQIVEDFIVGMVSGVVLAPLDRKALVPSVERLNAAGIPCVIIDSGIDTDKYVSFVATDNYIGGVIAARRMGLILGGSGRIVVVKYMPNSASTTNRENGFIDTIKNEFPSIRIVDAKYGMDTVETALQAVEDLLTKNTELDGLYACNASTSVGALQALRSQDRTDGIRMIGFDAEEALVAALTAGQIDSLVVQNPYKMGYEAVKAAADFIEKRPVRRRIDTGVKLVTRDNIGRAEIRQLLGSQ
jgi:ribose transport system substrate-binding protein